jgi:hypothetical protein
VLIIRDGAVWQLGIADWSLAGGQSSELALIDALETIYQQSVHVSGPLQALDGYWLAISAHNFAGALRYVVPGVVGSASGFVSSERREGVHSAQFQGRVISQRGSTSDDPDRVADHPRPALRLPHLDGHLQARPSRWSLADPTREHHASALQTQLSRHRRRGPASVRGPRSEWHPPAVGRPALARSTTGVLFSPR